MKTITIQIGNSDDKLTQGEWSEFVASARAAIERHASQIHFFGAAAAWERWQNAAWIIVADDSAAAQLKTEIKNIRACYKQDSAAWTEGETLFV